MYTGVVRGSTWRTMKFRMKRQPQHMRVPQVTGVESTGIRLVREFTHDETKASKAEPTTEFTSRSRDVV